VRALGTPAPNGVLRRTPLRLSRLFRENWPDSSCPSRPKRLYRPAPSTGLSRPSSPRNQRRRGTLKSSLHSPLPFRLDEQQTSFRTTTPPRLIPLYSCASPAPVSRTTAKAVGRRNRIMCRTYNESLRRSLTWINRPSPSRVASLGWSLVRRPCCRSVSRSDGENLPAAPPVGITPWDHRR
jgi:hypothetical protein